MDAIVDSFECRANGNVELERVWQQAIPRFPVLKDIPVHLMRPALANSLAIIRFGEVADITDLANLVVQFSGRQVAKAQDATLGVVDEPSRPLTTVLVRALGQRAWQCAGTAAEGTDLTDHPDLVQACSEAATWLLAIGQKAAAVPKIEGPEDLFTIVRTGGVLEWRALVSDAMPEPWSGRMNDYIAMLDQRSHAREMKCLMSVRDILRRVAEDDERATIATTIRRAIAGTGLTQREFAALVGTSASRMSSYVTGAVTPSAAMMLRITRTAQRESSRPRASGGTGNLE